jgi:hypothetical protein
METEPERKEIISASEHWCQQGFVLSADITRMMKRPEQKYWVFLTHNANIKAAPSQILVSLF